MKRRKKKDHELPELSPAQQEIMEIVWKKGEVSASQVREELSARKQVAKNTVRTLLERMEEKGWVVHREQGRTFLYSAAQPQEASIAAKVLNLVDKACGGSPEMLVSTLLDNRELSEDELSRIRKLLNKAARKRNK